MSEQQPQFEQSVHEPALRGVETSDTEMPDLNKMLKGSETVPDAIDEYFNVSLAPEDKDLILSYLKGYTVDEDSLKHIREVDADTFIRICNAIISAAESDDPNKLDELDNLTRELSQLF